MKLYLAALSTLLLSLGLLLFLLTHHQYLRLKARGELMLCMKETKGELHQFILQTEKINWAIQNIDKAKYLIFIPGLQAVAANSVRARELIIKYQDLTLAYYLTKLTQLRRKCPLGVKAFMTPYQIGPRGFKRHFNGTTIWRSKEWTTQITGKYEVAGIQIKEKKTSSLKPMVKYRYSIRKANALSRLPSFLDSSLLSSASMSL